MFSIKCIGWACGLALLGLGWLISMIGVLVCLWPAFLMGPFLFYLASGGCCAACFHEVVSHPPSTWRK